MVHGEEMNKLYSSSPYCSLLNLSQHKLTCMLSHQLAFPQKALLTGTLYAQLVGVIYKLVSTTMTKLLWNKILTRLKRSYNEKVLNRKQALQ